MGSDGSRRVNRRRFARFSVPLAAFSAVSLLFHPRPTHADDRSIDGSGNNVASLSLGQAGSIYIRESSGAHYADGVSSPYGGNRPDARTISNVLMTQGEASILDTRNLTAMVYTWGQFIDHDLNLRSDAVPAEQFNINIPSTDQLFDPLGTGTQVMPMLRSSYDPLSGTSTANPRQQINHVTSYLDASMVYGSDPARAAWLRSGTGGMLKSVATPTGAALPTDDGTQVMDGLTGPSTSSSLYVAGDGRANEQVGITSLHTLLLREHNRQATLLARLYPAWTDEQIYQHAKAIVSGEVESITYNGFLPAMLGGSAIPGYSGYNPTVDPSASNAFATVAFRVGHSMLDDDIERVGPDGNTVAAGNLPLRNAFFNPGVLKTNGGVDAILRGVTTRIEQSVDLSMVEDIRSFLFGPPGAGGLDLAALDIQRARDHGLSDYNTMRQDFGLTKVTTFAQITSDSALQVKLQQLYGDVDNIDSFVGCLAEDHLAGSSVGALTSAIIADQFTRTRDGDRFFYLNDPNLSSAEVNSIGSFSLAELIRRNTFVRNIQDNVFVAGSINSGPAWNLSTSGSWQTPGNWTGGLPNSAGAFAMFQSAPAGAASITLDAPTVLGSLQLTNPNGIAITAGSGGSITFDNLGSTAAVIITSGSHTISAPIALTDSLTVLYQGAGGLNLSGPISENYPGTSIIVDGSFAGPTGGGVTTLSGSNSFTGGISVTHSLVNLNHPNAQGAPGSTASASNNGEIIIGFTPTALHRFAINDLGAIRGDNTQFGGLISGVNLSVGSGAMITRQTIGGTLPAGLLNLGNLYSAYTSNVSGVNASITIGSTSGTPFKGIGSDRQSSYTWGNSSDVLTFTGDVDLVALGSSSLTIAAKLSGGISADTLTKRGTGAVKITNASSNFAAGNVVVQSGSLQFAYGLTQNFAASVNFAVQDGGTSAFNDGASTTINGSVLNNGAIVKPGGTNSQLIFHGGALTGNGILLAQDPQAGNSGSPNFVQTLTSTIRAHAIVFNNGVNNSIGAVSGLDSINSSPIIAVDGANTSVHLTGRWDGDGSAQTNWVVLTNHGRFTFDAGATLDTIADVSTQLRPFSGRGDGTGTVEFADGFVANQSDHSPVVEFYVWSPGNMTWITNNSLNFPDSNLEINQEDGGTWIVQTHDQTADCGLTTSRNFTIDTETNLTLARAASWAVFDGTKTVTKTGPGMMTIAGENAIPSGPTSRILSAVGSSLKIDNGHFVTMTDMGQAATSAGANAAFGAAGLPDADDVITTRYGWNITVGAAGGYADFNASQHLLSLKLNNGGIANLNNFTYGNGSHTTLTAQTLGTDVGSGTLHLGAGNSAVALSNFTIGPSSAFTSFGVGSLTITGSINFGTSAIMNISGGTATFNLPSAAVMTMGGPSAQINVLSTSTLNVAAASRDPLSVATNTSQRVNILSSGQFNLTSGNSRPGFIDGVGSTVLSTATSLQALHVRQSALTLQGTASLTITPKGDLTATSRLVSLAIAGSTNAWTAKVDLQDNDLVIDFPANGPDPIGTITNQIKTGRGNGNWAGNGITSSMADTYIHALGVADNAVLQLGSFSGQTIDPTSVLVKYTYAGDANLDGQVNVTDLTALATNWQSNSGAWTTGDFNYDGSVNINDLYMLANNWQAGVGAPLGASLTSLISTLGLPSSVPEPTLLPTLVVIATATTRRRRHK